MKVNEIFYSLQGEGRFTGVPAVFLRLSGCNLKCHFCDTQHEQYREMSVEEIMQEVTKYESRHIAITGGEPTMQLSEELTDALHKAGFFIQIETNGTIRLQSGVSVDWVTCSPKNTDLHIEHIDEVKLLCFGGSDEEIDRHLAKYATLEAQEYRLQPLDTGDVEQNRKITEDTIRYILHHPKWHLSLQTHKMLGVR